MPNFPLSVRFGSEFFWLNRKGFDFNKHQPGVVVLLNAAAHQNGEAGVS